MRRLSHGQGLRHPRPHSLRSRTQGLWAAFAACLLACHGKTAAIATPSDGEVLLVIDTDMPVPTFVARLRVDLYDANSAWYASRDFERSRVSAWPASFGLFVAAADVERIVTVRLRAFPEGGTRDYRGERFQPRPDPPTTTTFAITATPLPPSTDQPRLLVDGVDVTPPEEPQPNLTIDRLVRLRVHVGHRSTVRVVLHGACVGTMADLVNAQTCDDTEGVLVPVTDAPLAEGIADADADAADGGTSSTTPSLAGTFNPKGDCVSAKPPRPAGAVAPDGATKLFDDQVCVPGAMFRFGTPDGVLTDYASLPERVVVLDPFLIDRYEFTVARYRVAVSTGFVPPDKTPVVNETDFPTKPPLPTTASQCSWSVASPRGRETFPLNCISWASARAVCRFLGGDLPSEPQWEYVAAVASRASRTRFPWGGPDDTKPTCTRATWGRSGSDAVLDTTFACQPGFGPGAVDLHSEGEATGDVTPLLGVVGLGANVAEFTRDAIAPFTAPCWTSTSFRNPTCDVPNAKAHTLRGGAWYDDSAGLIIGVRRSETLSSNGDGFRCVYPAGTSQ